ncbi:terminase [Clostridium sporogenes]|uniref:terminase small subunit n=1 Tax=Clostridium sporogenes TaxID=1509 RepID=UPI0013D1163C|nr:terminase small subunit [Clostridium sporogenes]NFF66822.1 terminase [Clostridium sporogenes]NFF99382.1 terminase [Clostridium sporogenes]NFG06890.1 terminase [Clostridium sporogenes]NFG51440.1 terminase [Clostridium sporogenes]NFP84784.1 terminase [Clostridium sporogenes]
MESIRGPDTKEQAKKDYISGMKYKDIASKYDVSINTVKSWKQRYKWNRNGVHTEKKVCTQNRKNATKKIEPIVEEVKEVLENAELTDKQRLFCIYYVKSFNQTMAAIKAGYSPERAHVTGSELVRNSKVKAYIKELKGKMTEEIFIDAMDVLNKYIKIAFADITDYLTFGQKEVTVMGAFGPVKDGEGNELTKVVNYVDFKESNIIDGTIISEVKQGKDGVSIKFEDRMKALDKLSQYFDLFPDNFKRKIEDEKVKQSREKLELEKSKGNGDEIEAEDDGFLDALNGRATEVWNNE